MTLHRTRNMFFASEIDISQRNAETLREEYDQSAAEINPNPSVDVTMRKEFPVSNEGITAAFDFIAATVARLGVGETIAHRLSIVVDELCANMIRHDESLTAETNFTLCIQSVEADTVLIVRDPGKAFNPLEYLAEEVPEIGGHGINLVKGLATRISYDRIDGQNELTVAIDGSD